MSDDNEDFDNSPGYGYEGGVLSQATPAPPEPFPYVPSPALAPASAVGQTLGTLGGMGGLAGGLMSSLPWSQPEEQELARLSQAGNQVQSDILSGVLKPQHGDQYLAQLAPRLQALQAKQAAHQQQQQQQAKMQLMDQTAVQESILGEHKRLRAQQFPGGVASFTDPVSGETEHFYQDDKGNWKPIEFSAHRQRQQAAQPSQEPGLPADPNLTFNLQEPPGTADQPPDLGQLAQARRQQLVEQFPAGHQHVMTIEEGGKQRQVTFTKNANGTWSGGEGPPERGERDNLGRLTNPAGSDAGLAELKRRALQVAGPPPGSGTPAWMQHAWHDKYNGILQKLVGNHLLQSGHEKDLVHYQERLKQAAESKTQLEQTHHQLQTQLAHEKAALRRVGLGDVDEKEVGKELSKHRSEIDRQFHALARLYGDPEKKVKMTDEQLQMYRDLDSEEKREKESIGLTYDFFRFRKQIGSRLSDLRKGQGATAPPPPPANPGKPLELQGPPYSGARGGNPGVDEVMRHFTQGNAGPLPPESAEQKWSRELGEAELRRLKEKYKGK